MMFNKKSQLLGVCKKSLPLAIALALTACGGSSSETDQSVGALKIGTHPVFDPLAGSLPLNTDLLFAAAASSDGTANVGVPTNPAEAAINALDGFSTSAYFDIAFAGGSIDADTVVACQLAMLGTGACAQANVFVLALDTGGNDALDPANVVGVDTPSLPAFEASVVSLDGGTDNTLRIAPLEPLKAKTKYLVFVTNGVKETSGQPITPSGSYHVLGENVPDLTPALQPVRGAVQGWESIAAAFLNSASGGAISLEQARDSVAVSYTFTTTDPIAPLVAMAAPRAALVQAQIGMGVAPADAVTNANNLDLAGLLSTPKARDTGISAVTGIDLGTLTGGALPAGRGKLYTGYIKLPYYLTTPDTSADYTQDNWVADQVLGSQLGEGLPPADLDGSFNVTYRYPFAAQQSTESVPLQVTMPEPGYAPPSFGGATCEQARPDGYPVVVYVHGITSDRASVVALAHSLASVCVATVTVDQPLHGVVADGQFAALNVESSPLIPFATLYGEDAPRERHFNDAGGSGAQFINLAVLTNTRDNLRQSVMDLLNLNASLDGISGALDAAAIGTLNTGDVKVVGASLGGIVGTVYSTVNQVAMGAEASVGFASNLKPLGGLVVSAGGSQLTQILNHSQTFGPIVKEGLAANGVNEGTTNYERFLYVAQSTVDSGDPVNFAGTLAGLGVPVLVQQIVGGGDVTALGDGKVYTADKVVPNSAEGAPLAGTTALATLLGAQATAPGVVDVSAANALVNLAIGHHGSLLRPSETGTEPATMGENIATAELQTQAVSFVLSAGVQTAVGSAPDGTNLAAPFIVAD